MSTSHTASPGWDGSCYAEPQEAAGYVQLTDLPHLHPGPCWEQWSPDGLREGRPGRAQVLEDRRVGSFGHGMGVGRGRMEGEPAGRTPCAVSKTP